tara:strand:- start:5 stop:118 length:114 start_codon:yes stop_codon:yes gene_type:complete
MIFYNNYIDNIYNIYKCLKDLFGKHNLGLPGGGTLGG